MINILFYWIFWPGTRLASWRAHMWEGLLAAIVLIGLGLAVYWAIPYNRKREKLKFFACHVFIIVAAVVYVLFNTASIPDDISRGAYKWWFGVNIVLATSVWGFVIFYIFSNFMKAKKYFARLTEYIFK